MKRLITAFLALALLTLAGCGGAEPNPTETTQPQASAGAENTTTAPAPETTAPAETPEVQFPVVLVDSEACYFAIEDAWQDPIWGYTLTVSLQNRTDQSLDFFLRDAAINGYMSDPLFYETVDAGASLETEVSFADDSYTRDGLQEVRQVSFLLEAKSSENLFADPVVAQTCLFHPLGVAPELPQRPRLETDTLLYEDENCAIILTGVDPDNLWGYTLNLYLENKTDKDLMFSVEDATVNGQACDPFWAAEVAAGGRRHTDMTWFTSSLQEAGIETVQTISLPVTVYDSNDWLADYLVEQTLTVTP